MRSLRILGVDPGSRMTGYGCVDRAGNQLTHVTHGVLQLAGTKRKKPSFEDRLHEIYLGLSQVIQDFKPDVMSIEKVFLAKNAVSALKLGQARGAAILTAKIHHLNVVEYSATEVKQAIVGYGRADKLQVQKMVQVLTGKKEFFSHDASDGLALALCHAQLSRNHPLIQHKRTLR